MTWLLAITTMSAFAQQATVTGPDSFLKVNVSVKPVSYTHLRAHETDSYLVCRLLLEKKKY